MAPGTDNAPDASVPPDGGGGGGGGGGGDGGAGRSGEEHTSRRKRLRWLAAGALAVVAVAVLAVVLLSAGSGEHHSAETGVPAGETTATVTRRTLSESSTVDGTLGYGSTLELYDRLGGTFTWLPAVGAVIGRGGTLWRIDNLPIVLMYGSVPAYRTLKQGVSDGPDVTELNQNLIDLGFDPYGAITDDESFGEATTGAVKRWQKTEGLPETGEVELGRVVFASGARRVTDIKVTLGQDPPSAEGQPAKENPAKENRPRENRPRENRPRENRPRENRPRENLQKKSPPKTRRAENRAKARLVEKRVRAPARWYLRPPPPSRSSS